MPTLFALLTLLSAPAAPVPGVVSDALAADLRPAAGGGVWLTVADAASRRRALRPAAGGGPSLAVPAGALFVDVCSMPTAPDRLVFVDADGIRDAEGARLLAGPSLFSVADDEHLWVAPVCGPDGELRLPVAAGLLVGRPGKIHRS